MGGKAAILVVLGFSMIFLVVGYNMGNLSTNVVGNYVDYYSETNAYNIAVSGANMAAREIFEDVDWNTGYNNIDFSNGKLNVTVTANGVTRKITSIGTVENMDGPITKKVEVTLQPSSYAKFAWYAGNMSSKVFIDQDTVWGPLHSQSQMNIGGDPVFYGKLTCFKGFSPDPKLWSQNGYDPKFYGGYETGVNIPLPNNYEFTEQKQAAVDGVAAGGNCYFENTDLWLTFNPDGTITYRTGTGADSSTYSAPITVDQDDLAPTDIIYLKKGNIYVAGEMTGQMSIVSGESSGMGNGNVYLVDDLTYVNDPVTYAGNNRYDPTSSTDMLGIMSTNNVIIADTTPNENDIHVDASIFCAQGGFQAEGVDHIDDHGKLYMRGGIVAAKEETLAKIITPGVIKGFRKHVIFDERNRLGTHPPLFPLTDSYEIVSWYE